MNIQNILKVKTSPCLSVSLNSSAVVKHLMTAAVPVNRNGSGYQRHWKLSVCLQVDIVWWLFLFCVFLLLLVLLLLVLFSELLCKPKQ